MTLEVTILGCGSSGGVPRIDGNWGACDPANAKNRRSRCSLLVRRRAEAGETTVVVDTSPDFRTQMISAAVQRLDAVLYTHDHADQTHGIDDFRAYAILQRRRMHCFMDAYTKEALTRRFHYIFSGEQGYPPIAEALDIPPHGEAWSVSGPGGEVPVVTFAQEHGPIESVGYRFGGVAYSSDVSGLDDKALAALQNLDLWIVDALRWTPHPTHASVDTALGWIRELKPKRAVLTNLHVDLDYEALKAALPSGVEPAFDGWSAEFAL